MLNNLKFVLTGLFFPAILVTAQVNTGSPYSRFGLGEIRQPGFTSNISMGGAGIALRTSNLINYINPASYSALDSLSFIFDFGVNSSSTKYYTNEAESQLNNYNIDHIAIAFPITKWWKSAVGVTPYSSIGYNIKVQNLIPVIGVTDYYYQGDGGLSKFFIGNSFNPLSRLSLGFNLSYILNPV